MKSREGLKHLQSKGFAFEVIEYTKTGMNEKELKQILTKLNAEPQDMIRTQETMFKKELKGKKFTREEWIRIMVENTNLIKRPIVVREYKAVWADPPDEMDRLFSKQSG